MTGSEVSRITRSRTWGENNRPGWRLRPVPRMMASAETAVAMEAIVGATRRVQGPPDAAAGPDALGAELADGLRHQGDGFLVGVDGDAPGTDHVLIDVEDMHKGGALDIHDSLAEAELAVGTQLAG